MCKIHKVISSIFALVGIITPQNFTNIRIIIVIVSLFSLFFQKECKKGYLASINSSKHPLFINNAYTNGRRTTSALSRRPRTTTAICVPAFANSGFT